MKRTRHTPEQVINKFREAETMLAGGRTVAQVLQHLVVSEATFNHWLNHFDGMKSEEARWLIELKIEKARLKLLVAEKELDIAILRKANDYLKRPRADWAHKSGTKGRFMAGQKDPVFPPFRTRSSVGPQASSRRWSWT